MAISVLHDGNVGDIIYSLPALKELARRRNDKVVFYIRCNVVTNYYPGANHPLKNVLINDDLLSKLKPLLLQQSYIDKVEKFYNGPIEFNLNEFRSAVPSLDSNHIPRWYFPVLKVCCDLSKPWLHVASTKSNAVVINRSSRYQNSKISYSFLKNYECVFVGLPEEHKSFCEKNFEIEHKQIADFAELAAIIAGAKLFIGNQSFAFAVAEGLKVPRIVEVCPWANNIIPHGDKAYEVYCQRDFEHYVKELA